jgi:O-antigen/teichoic acid export membrane protein
MYPRQATLGRITMMVGLVRKLSLQSTKIRGTGAAVLGTVVTSMVTRSISIIASLLTVPFVLHHLGEQRYGVWMAAIALSTFFTMGDGGITKGLLSEVSHAFGARDRPRIRMLIASALATTCIFVLIFSIVVVVVTNVVDWTWAFNLSDPELGWEAGCAVLTISLCYVLAFIPTVIRETRVGMLEGTVVNLWDATGLVIGFVGVVLAVQWGFGLVAIAGIWTGAPTIMRAANALVFLGGQGRDLVPSRHDIDLATCRSLISAGGTFMLYTLALVLAVQSDQVLIARFLGPEAVTQYSIVQRLFNQPQVIVTLGLIAQWPAYGEALGRGDDAWIRRHFRWSLIGYAAFSAVISCLLAVLCDAILQIWVGGFVVAPPHLVVAMAVYGVVATVANVFVFFYMSLAIHRRLIITQILFIVITVPLYLLLIPRLGVTGAVVAATVGQLCAVVAPGLWSMSGIFSNLSSAQSNHSRSPTTRLVPVTAAR